MDEIYQPGRNFTVRQRIFFYETVVGSLVFQAKNKKKSGEMMEQKNFYLCKQCGNLVEMIDGSGIPIICCGEPMTRLAPNTVDASYEKHLPVVTVAGDIVQVEIGSVPHPMTEQHYIMWIYLQTKHGAQRKQLAPGEAPKTLFALKDDEALAAYAYCNLHGLWLTEIASK